MDRILRILEIILKSDVPLSVDFIAGQIKTSNKTIRNDLSKIEELVTKGNLRLCRKPGVGITIEGSEERKLELINSVKNSINYIEPHSPEDRLNYILKTLFMNKTSVTTKELCDSLYVSRVTIQKDLERVEEWLLRFNLKLKKKSHLGIEIIGCEEDWRKAIACLLASNKGYDELKELLYDEYEGKIDYKSISKLKELVNIDYRILEKIVSSAETKLKFKFSDEAFISLIMHIAISIKRLKDGKDIKLSDEMMDNLKGSEEYEISKQIALDIENAFKVKLPESEVGYILLHILGTKLLEGKSSDLNIDFQYQGEDELAVIIAKEIINIAQRSLHINLSNDKQFFNGLILHLRPTINRLKYGLTLRNPILHEIKENYSEIYGAAWMTTTVFEKYLDIKMPEEEIGYICLHLAAAVERNKNPYKALVVCASGIGTSQFIAARLERSFKQIDIIDVISVIELKHRRLDDIDMVISTVPVEASKPILMISPILNQNDIRRLELFLEKLSIKNNDYIELKTHIDKTFIKTNSSVENKEALIKQICKELMAEGYVCDGFLESVIEREEIYSTAIGRGVSIPHGNPKFVKHSCLMINILEHSVDWGNEDIDIVIFLCIRPEDKEKSKKWFRNLYNFIDRDDAKDILKRAQSSEEISRIMEEFIC